MGVGPVVSSVAGNRCFPKSTHNTITVHEGECCLYKKKVHDMHAFFFVRLSVVFSMEVQYILSLIDDHSSAVSL